MEPDGYKLNEVFYDRCFWYLFSRSRLTLLVELAPNVIINEESKEPLIGKQVNILGDWNPFTHSTSNSAKMVDVDMASGWTSQIFSGLFSLGDLQMDKPTSIGLTGCENTVACSK